MKTALITGAIVLATAFVFRSQLNDFVSNNKTEKKVKKEKIGKNSAVTYTDVSIKQKWDLPQELLEVSGIAYIDANRFACVQDEAGTIYIYNTKTANIEKKIAFTGPGDFEGISLNGSTAYIVRSDGAIFEVDMDTKKTTEYRSSLTIDNNVETLFFDKANNRLLLAGKEPDVVENFKNILAFDLDTKSMVKDPVVKIDLTNPALANNGKAGKKKKAMMPSAIAIHPLNKDIYLLDGPKSRLLVTQADGVVKNVYELGKEFFKPEGISFSPAGDLFISNEGKKTAPNIIEVELLK